MQNLAPHLQSTGVSSLVGECRANSLKQDINIYGVHAHIYEYFVFEPNFKKLYTCIGSGCPNAVITAMKPSEQEDIIGLFEKDPPQNAKEERERIALAMAIFEQHIGRQEEVYTWGDAGKNSFSGNNASTAGHDCISEAHNALSYLLILQNERLLFFHRVKNLIFRTQPHNAVEIEEKTSSQSFVVDTWALNNGYPAVIIHKEDWQGRKQEEEAIERAKALVHKLPPNFVDFLKNNNLLYE